jgi:short-subunit dehydrogenase
MTRTVLITGATSGIGFSLAETFLENNYNVIITGRNADKLIEADSYLKKYKGFIGYFNVNVTDKDEMESLILSLDDKYKIDIIIANAGISAGVSGIDFKSENFNKIAYDIFNTNVFGVFNTIHPIIERFKQRKSGNIIIISSMSAFFGMDSALFYASSKAAIKSYGEGLRVLLKPLNINVTTIFPGFVQSNITKANNFKMPLFMNANKAAKIIFNGIIKNKGYIAFPFILYISVYFLSILPFSLRELILDKLPKKN